MTAELVFSFSNGLAVAGWLLLILGARLRRVSSLVAGLVLPLLFALLYAALIAAHWGDKQGGFGSIEQVRALFSNDWLLLAGWVHYLAFDLFVGSWEVRDARKHAVPHLMVIPCLLLTFLFGPAGFLLYYMIRSARTRKLAQIE